MISDQPKEKIKATTVSRRKKSMGTCQTKNRPNPRCSGCHEPKPTEVEYTNLGDGRYLCPDCRSISLFEPRELEPIIRQVLYSFFDDHLKLPVRKDIPIFFVDANEIKMHEINDTDMVYGVTLVGGGSDKIKIVKRCVRSGTNIKAVTKTKEVNGDVATILLLFGNPKSVVGATLAYQMVRAWIRLQGWTFTLETSVEESICGVVASMWLDYTADENDPSYTENNATLSRYRRGLLESGGADGAEFLKAKRAVEKYGLESTLMQLAQTIPE